MAIVQFKTDISVCSKMMHNISGLSTSEINPMIGDNVRVYHDSSNEIYMKVIERQWIMINGTQPILHCILDAPDGYDVFDFLQKLYSMGFK